jgi:hypothetical protein
LTLNFDDDFLDAKRKLQEVKNFDDYSKLEELQFGMPKGRRGQHTARRPHLAHKDQIFSFILAYLEYGPPGT